MNREELFRNKLYVSSPTSISIGCSTWFALDTKLVGRVKAMIEENQQLKERINKAIEYIETNKQDKEFKFEDRKYYSEYLINKILEILKGDNDE